MNAKGYYYQYSKNEYVASEPKYFKVLLDEVENSDVMRIAEFPDGHRHELTLAQVQSLGSNPIGWVGKQVRKKKRGKATGKVVGEGEEPTGQDTDALMVLWGKAKQPQESPRGDLDLVEGVKDTAEVEAEDAAEEAEEHAEDVALSHEYKGGGAVERGVASPAHGNGRSSALKKARTTNVPSCGGAADQSNTVADHSTTADASIPDSSDPADAKPFVLPKIGADLHSDPHAVLKLLSQPWREAKPTEWVDTVAHLGCLPGEIC